MIRLGELEVDELSDMLIKPLPSKRKRY